MKLEISRKKIDQDFELLGLNHMIVIVQISTTGILEVGMIRGRRNRLSIYL